MSEIGPKTVRTEQYEFEARTTDPANTEPGEYWVRVDQTSSDPDVVAELRRQDNSGVTKIPLFDASEESNLGSKMDRGPSVVLDNGTVGFVAMTTESSAEFGSPRVVTAAGEEYLSHDALTLTTIPDDVVRQYTAPSFATPWPLDVGAGDMSISGLKQSTFPDGDTSVSADGSDYGLAPAPNIMNQQSFGFAFSVNIRSGGSGRMFMSGYDGTRAYQIHTDTNTEIRPFFQDDNGNRLSVSTGDLTTGTTHAVIINKSDDTPSGIDIYVDDMSASVSTTVKDDGGYDSSNASDLPIDMGFYARHTGGGSTDNPLDGEMGTIEFAESPYDQSQRDGFVDRRPELS